MIDQKISLIFNEPVHFNEKVELRIPTLYEAVTTNEYFMYSRIFTISTRLIFGQLRNVEELVSSFPTIWEMMFSEDTDAVLGKVMGYEGLGSDCLINALVFWTGLSNDKDTGFKKLGNGKIIHIDSDWVIDKKEFIRFSDIVKTIVCYDPESERQFIPPRINSDASYKAWMTMYKRRAKQSGKGSSIADKIGILSVMTDGAILPEKMKSMSVFLFNKLYDGLQSKEAYERYWQIQVSPKFASDKATQKHWTETFRI